MACWRGAGVKRIMARKSRSPRSARTAKKARRRKAAPKARAQGAARKRATPNMVETALAAFAHEVRTPLTGILAVSDLLATSDLDERERRWVDTIKAGAEHLAGLATLFVDAARSGNSGLGVRQDFFDLARARPQRRRFAGRARRRQGPAIVGRDFGEASRLRDRRSGSFARRAGKPGRQRGEIHGKRQRRAERDAGARREGQGRRFASRFPTAASALRSPRSSACSARSRRPMSRSRRASAAPDLDCRR